MNLARAFPETAISGMGGVETADDAAEFILMGSSTVQVCTGAMLRGYELIEELCQGLSDFMDSHALVYRRLPRSSLQYFTTHADLVARQREAKIANAGRANRNNMWKGNIAKETEELASEGG